MNILCDVFGHRRPEHGILEGEGEDGTGRLHYRVVGRCERCNERITLARTHLYRIKIPEGGTGLATAAGWKID